MIPEGEGCRYGEEERVASLSWSRDEATLVADVPAGTQWELEVTARFGGRSLTWTLPPRPGGEGGHLSWTVTVPAEALLDPQCAEYATDLSFRLVGVSERGDDHQVSGPPGWLLWQRGAPVVVGPAGLARLAPSGVLGGVAGIDPEVRVLPPIVTIGAPTLDRTVEGD